MIRSVIRRTKPFLLVCLLLFVASCGESGLTREEAAEILQKQNCCQLVKPFDFPFGTEFRFRGMTNSEVYAWEKEISSYITGQNASIRVPKPKADETPGPPLRQFVAFLRFLKANGVLDSVNVASGVAGSAYLQFEIVPAQSSNCQKIRIEQSGSFWWRWGAGFVCQVAVGEWKLIAVTGISGEGETRLVEYELELVSADAQKDAPKNTVKRTASFRRFDDGWRRGE